MPDGVLSGVLEMSAGVVLLDVLGVARCQSASQGVGHKDCQMAPFVKSQGLPDVILCEVPGVARCHPL